MTRLNILSFCCTLFINFSFSQELPLAKSFDFPVGKPDAKGYYNAQRFGENNHLGEDWNATSGGDTDLGDPIYSIATGKVTLAADIGGGWGKIIRIAHHLPDGSWIESLYAHCDQILVKEGDIVSKGTKIATIGNNKGQYLAHLHFELRSELALPAGGGYGTDTTGYLNPTEFIKSHRN